MSATFNPDDAQSLGEGIAREMTGFDLAQPLGDGAVADIMAAFAENPVLVFRAQSLSAPALARFARTFGAIRPGVDPRYQHPDAPEISYLTNVAADGGIDRFGVKRAAAWHYDGSFAEIPPVAAMLHALEIPETGGGTLFADTRAAFAALSPEDQATALELSTVNHFGMGPEGGDYFDRMTPEAWAAYTPVRKPLAPVCRRTGARHLQFCMIHTAGFVGMTHRQGRARLAEYLAHATKPSNVYYHRWRVGDVVLWDEHATLHRNAGDFAPEARRIMLRAMVGPHPPGP